MGRNMLVFHNDSDTSYANYADNLTSMSSATAAVTLRFLGQGASATATSTDAVVLTVTAGQEENVMEAIAGALANARAGMTVVASDVSGKTTYLHGGITAVNSISVDTGAGTFKNVIDKAASANVLEITNADSGSIVMLRNNGAGCEIRLPLAPVDGFNFKLIAKQDMDSNNYDIKAASGGPTAFEGILEIADSSASVTGTAQVRLTGANVEMGDYLNVQYASTAGKYYIDGMFDTGSAVTVS